MKGELERTLTELLGRMAQREAESRRWSEDSKSLVAWLAAERTRLDKAWRALGLEVKRRKKGLGIGGGSWGLGRELVRLLDVPLPISSHSLPVPSPSSPLL